MKFSRRPGDEKIQIAPFAPRFIDKPDAVRVVWVDENPTQQTVTF